MKRLNERTEFCLKLQVRRLLICSQSHCTKSFNELPFFLFLFKNTVSDFGHILKVISPMVTFVPLQQTKYELLAHSRKSQSQNLASHIPVPFFLFSLIDWLISFWKVIRQTNGAQRLVNNWQFLQSQKFPPNSGCKSTTFLITEISETSTVRLLSDASNTVVRLVNPLGSMIFFLKDFLSCKFLFANGSIYHNRNFECISVT